MYRLLMVDNEEYIVESLLFYLENQEDIEVFGCYSAAQALERMERMRIDILITDIRMPGMDGLELQKQVSLRWPMCRTIFLSGYEDFEYIHQAVRNGGCDYLLKSEGKEALLQSVRKVIAQFKKTEEREVLLRQAQEKFASVLPLLRNELLKSILHASDLVPADLEPKFRELNITLRSDQNVYLVLGRMDDDLRARSWDGELALVSVQGVADEYFKSSFLSFSVAYSATTIVWLLQPKGGLPEDEKKIRLRAGEMIENIQLRCARLLNHGVSFAMAAEPVCWNEISAERSRLECLFYFQTLDNAILQEHYRNDPAPQPEAGSVRAQMERLRTLAAYLEAGNRNDFLLQLSEIIRFVESAPHQAKEDLWLEILYHLNAMMITQINRWGIKVQLAQKVDIQPLADGFIRMNRDELLDYMRRLIDELFSLKNKQIAFDGDDMVTKLQRIISNDLGGDLSLPRLGEIVDMNPYYMSRLYQKLTGERILTYIADLRFEKAKQLLIQSNMINRDIAKMIGIGSEQTFHRFFKKSSGMTPQEFRMKYKKDN